MSIPPFSIILSVDREHLAELAESFPTWMRCDRLRNATIVAALHPEISSSDLYNVIDWRKHRISTTFVREREGWSRRELMLSAFVFDLPQFVTSTSHYLKLDCDSIFLGGDWINPVWFANSPMMIASKWGYSKPADTYDRLDAWAATIPSLAHEMPPIREKLADRVKSCRIISYVQFGNVQWTRKIAVWCGDRLPVPSQDSLLSYCAERGGFNVCRVRLPQWRHIGRGGERLAAAAREAMNGM